MTTPAKERRRPVESITFRLPVEIPGVDMRSKRLVSGKPLPVSGAICPQVWIDLEYRCVVIIGPDSEAYHYPMDGGLVERFTFALMAKGSTKA